MFNSFIKRLLWKSSLTPVIHPASTRQTELGLETLEKRDVPSSTPVTANSYGMAYPILAQNGGIGTHDITSPNGLHHAIIVNGTLGNSEVFEDGKVVWMQKGGWVGEALFSHNGNHLAIVVDTKVNGWSVIEDGKIVGSGYTQVGALTFSQDGTDLAYVIYDPVVMKGGDEVVENGNVVSSTYYGVGNLQFSQQSDQLNFVGYQSETFQSPPAGIMIPDILLLDIIPITATGVWGKLGTVIGASLEYAPIPSDPINVVVG